MNLFNILKWVSYIFTGTLALLVSTLFIFSLVTPRMPLNETTKTCLITGASSGIGQNLAIVMVSRGWKVIGVARRAEMLNALQEKLGEQNFIPYVCDVSNLEQIHEVSEKIKSQELKPTLFFLNAGTGELNQKWQMSTASHQRTFATNYFGTIAWVEEWLLPVKQLGGGTFVATSSVLALLATPGPDAYAASKIALVHCFDSLKLQYLHDNIGFSVVLPGPTDTEMLKGASAKKMPFIHKADDEARYIVDAVFVGKKRIEPSWFYSIMLRVLGFLPDELVVKLLGC